MNEKNQDIILKKAIKKYGIFLQLLMVLEETAELQQILLKIIPKNHVIDQFRNFLSLFMHNLKELRKEYSENDENHVIKNTLEKAIKHGLSEPIILEKLIDEIVDTQIMLNQLKIIIDNESGINERIDFKLNRLLKRLEL